ncbi:MAG: cupin domain-containing protein [Vicinamibacterales bacterium]
MIMPLAVMLMVPIAVAAQAGALSLPRMLVQPDSLIWTTAPNGIQTTVVLGDPAKPGIYIQRLRFPKGTRIMPHMHPDERVAVLLSGSFYFGYGETFDDQGLTHVVAGTTWTEPSNTGHFAWAKDEDVVVQVVGHGPSGTVSAKK